MAFMSKLENESNFLVKDVLEIIYISFEPYGKVADKNRISCLLISQQLSADSEAVNVARQ